MKYLDKKGMPRYRSMPKIDMPDNEVDNRVNLMEVEADEMLYTGEMKELLWIKSLDKGQYRQLMNDESKARSKKLDKIIEAWKKV